MDSGQELAPLQSVSMHVPELTNNIILFGYFDKDACFLPELSRGAVVLPRSYNFIKQIYFSGDEIMYECVEGFQPADNGISVCSVDGVWTPNATLLHACTGEL